MKSWPNVLGLARGAAVCGAFIGCTLASAANVYRCEGGGVTAFVDSPGRCPDSQAQRQGALGTRDVPAPRVPAAGSGRTAATAPTAAPPGARVASACQAYAADPTRLRDCLRQERRAEVQRLTTARLQAIGRVVEEHLRAAARAGSVIAIMNNGRPAAWCEGVLGDVMAQKNLAVVDDESEGGPRWIESGDPGRAAAPIVDPDYREWRVAGGAVPDGYVTVRWRSTNLLVVRVVAGCVDVGDGTARCAPTRLTSIFVHGDAPSQACQVSVVERPYWPSWKNSMTPIFAAGLPAAAMAR